MSLLNNSRARIRRPTLIYSTASRFRKIADRLSPVDRQRCHDPGHISRTIRFPQTRKTGFRACRPHQWGIRIPRFHSCTSLVSLHIRISVQRLFFTVSAIDSHQTLKKDEFYALLAVADLGVITPLRDGMNTTSMEFVIAQEMTKKSPLVLSEFMGISKNMEEALQVNPWNLGVRGIICTLCPVINFQFPNRMSQLRSIKA